jgi:hypothetical protein
MGVTELNSYIPLPGTSFTVMTYASRTGSTLNVINETSYPGLRFTPTFGATSLTLLAGALFPGDANLDGQVDVTDLGALATNWQTAAPWTGGDFNYDGFVDVTDLGALATNWQAGVGSPLAPSRLEDALAAMGLTGVTVPEPTAFAGAVTSFATVCVAARRHRHGRRRR